MKNIFMILLFVLMSTTCYAKHIHKERWYQDGWVASFDGGTAIAEFRLTDGKRVDIITDLYAIECDFGSKFFEALGQSLYYAAKTGLIPGIVLIIETEKDEKYIGNLQDVIDFWKLPIKVWIVRP